MTRIVDLSMTVEECDSAPFAPEKKYFKLKPIITWEDKGFVSNTVQMTVHVGTHIDSPHFFSRQTVHRTAAARTDDRQSCRFGFDCQRKSPRQHHAG